MSIPHRYGEKNKEKSIKGNFLASIILATLILMTAIIVASSSPLSPYHEQSAFGQAFRGQNGNIVFPSARDGNNEIYTITGPLQRDQRRLTNNEADDRTPSISPDGNHIVFISNRDGNFEIYTMNADGTNQIRRTNNDAIDDNPSFSRDGSRIIFTSNRDGDAEVYRMTIPVDGTSLGSQVTQLTNNRAEDGEARWAPNRDMLVFTSNRDGNPEIYFMDSNGMNQRRFATVPTATRENNPSWSPDGSNIVFQRELTRDDLNTVEIFRANIGTRGEQRLTDNQIRDFSPSWSPDGTGIAFATNRDGNFEIYTMNADGTNQIRRTVNRAGDFTPMWGTPETIVPGYSVPPVSPTVTDTDSDGIRNNIDYDCRDDNGDGRIDPQRECANERERPSNHFSDVPIGGRTSGSVARGDIPYDIRDAPNPEGVNFRGVSERGPPPNPAPSVVTVDRCPTGTTLYGMMVTPVSLDMEYMVTCRSLDLTVFRGTIPTTLTAVDGSTAKLNVPALNRISFDPTTDTLTAGPRNIDTLNVVFVVGDVEQEPRQLHPGGSLVVNTVPPETTIDSATDGQGKNPIQDGSRTPSQGILFEFSSPDSDVSIIECSLDSKTWEACPNNVAGYDNLAEGGHFFSVRAKDVAGNVDPTPDVFSWTIDTIPPETTIDSATDGQGNLIQDQSSTLSTDISFEFSSPDSDDVSVFECSLDGGDWEACPGRLPAGVIAETEVHRYSHLQSGEHIFEVRAKDVAGNVDPTPATRIWTVTSAEEPLPPTNVPDMTPPKL